jgi:LacI family transcriptional regulator
MVFMVTIHDVAHKAQVSTATVSRVINGTRFVDPTIKKRVHSAMRELGYRPNLVARGLRQRSTRMIGLVIQDNSNPFFAELARAVEDAGFAEGYSVILCNSDLSDEKRSTYIDLLLSRQVDGLMLIAPGTSEEIERILAVNVPVVIANYEKEGAGVDEVVVDTEHGGYLAGEYLLRLGHRRIGCIANVSDRLQWTKRTAGFYRALAEAGISPDERTIAYGDGRYESGRRAMHELLSRKLDLSAAFVFDDLMALGALNVLLTCGFEVPKDMSLIGFDDILYASAVVPALTTIAQPIAEIGRACMRLLLERIHNPAKEPTRIVLPTRLVERASCRAIEPVNL